MNHGKMQGTFIFMKMKIMHRPIHSHRSPRLRPLVLALAAALPLLSASVQAQSFTPLGDLAGGNFES
ncbi:MAG: hypothetical protein FJY34_11805, partial [Betaproteobacteria bacterium]|nr:hypothetical protein [Betaproteobacteria bacterium]